MEFGIAGSNVGPFTTRAGALALVRAAEDAGFESLWTFEHVVVPTGYRSRYPYSPTGRMPGDGAGPIGDPLAWCTFAAAVSERIKVGTGILILPEHNPVVLAKECATIDQLSQGRLLLGIGVGWLREEFEALGVPWEGRGRRTDEYVAAMRALWAEEEASFHGEAVRFERVRCSPRPVAGSVPVIVGGHSEAAARRAGRLGDGFFPAAPPERVAELVGIMRDTATGCGRDPDAIEVTAAASAVGAPPAEVIEAYVAAGVHRIVVGVPTFNPAEVGEALARLGEALAPLR